MSTAPVNIPMFDPSGAIRQIPMPSVKDALASGGKIAVRMSDPNGVERWVPHDLREQALAAGGKMLEDVHPQVQQQMEDTGVLAGVSRALKGIFYDAPVGLYKAATTPTTPAETQAILAPIPPEDRSPLYSVLGPDTAIGRWARQKITERGLPPAANVINRVLLQPAQEQQAQAREAAAQGRTSETLAHSTAAALPIVGPYAAQLGARAGQGDISGAAAEAATTFAVPHIAGKIIGRVAAPKIVPAEQVEAMASFIDSRAGAVDPHAMATEITPILQRQAAADGLNLTKLQGRAAGQAALRTVNNAVNTLANEVTQIQKPFANTVVDQEPIARAYLDRVTDELRANDRPAANRLLHEAGKYAQLDKQGNIVGPKPATLQQVDLLRRRLNNETAAAQSRSEGAYRKTAWETQADVAAVAAARDVQYGNLARLSGENEAHIRTLQRQEGQLMEMRDSLSKEVNRVSEAQAGAVAASLRANPPGSGRFSTALREKVGHTYPSRAGVERSLIHEFVGPKPLETLNNRLQLAFGEPGAAPAPTTTPPAVAPATAPAPAPPAPTVTLGPGAEGISGITRSINIGGQKVGHITYEISGDTATIHHFGGPERDYNAVSNKLGRRGLQEVAAQLQQAHPEVKYVQGIRVGGLRGEEGRSVRIEIPKQPSAAASATARTENAYYTQARSELGADAAPEAVQARVQELKARGVQMPTPPPSIVHRAATKAHPLTGAQRSAAIGAIMSQLKAGEINQQDADRQIQRITGGGGRKLVRMPQSPKASSSEDDR